MCPEVLEKPKKAHNGVKVSVKLDIIRCIWYELVGYFEGLGTLKKFFHIN